MMAELFKKVRERLAFNDKGEEMPDPKPMEVPAGLKRPETMQERIRRLVKTELSQVAARQGMETLDEANDFEVEDDSAEDFMTNYEVHAMVEETPREQRASEGGRRSGSGRPVERGPGETGEGGGGEDQEPEDGDTGDDGEDDDGGGAAPAPDVRSGGRGGQGVGAGRERVEKRHGPVRSGVGTGKQGPKVRR